MTRDLDRRFLSVALNIGKRGLGTTWPNPSVGCVIARDGRMVASGATGAGGRPHAETVALEGARDAARGATAYVSLEPCNHHGKTPPCTEALLAAGIARIVIAKRDPDPRVAGRGAERLRAADVDVALEPFADLTRTAAAINRGHIMRVTRGRPFVTLKLALSKDGGIGLRGAGQIAITTAPTNMRMHRLRAHVDAIAVGAGTVRADDPKLTVRARGWVHRRPIAVVFGDVALHDRQLAQLRTPDQLVQLSGVNLESDLQALGRRGITSLLVEGGAALSRSFLAAGLVDELIVIEGGTKLGNEAIRPFDGALLPPGDAWLLRTERALGGDTIRVYDPAVGAAVD